MCSLYKSKKAAIKENRKNNKRRIIIKRVPSSIDEGIIKDSIEYLFGPISVFFSFLPEAMQVKNPYRNRRLHKSYSIMFTDKHSAQKAANAGKFFLRGYGELAIEPFRQNFTEKNNVGSLNEQYTKYPTTFTYDENELKEPTICSNFCEEQYLNFVPTTDSSGDSPSLENIHLNEQTIQTDTAMENNPIDIY